MLKRPCKRQRTSPTSYHIPTLTNLPDRGQSAVAKPPPPAHKLLMLHHDSDSDLHHDDQIAQQQCDDDEDDQEEECLTARFGQQHSQPNKAPGNGSGGGGLFSNIVASLFTSKNSQNANENANPPVNNSQVQPLNIVLQDIDEHTGLPNFTFLPNVASEELGAKILFVTDEFFGKAENVLKDGKPDSGGMTEFGVVPDGWATRRRRRAGHDWLVVKLAEPAYIRGFDFDINEMETAAPNVSIEGGFFKDLDRELEAHLKAKFPLELEEGESELSGSVLTTTFQSTPHGSELIESVDKLLDEKPWQELLPLNRLKTIDQGHNYFGFSSHSEDERKYSHIRLNIFPDGGLSRLRVYGEITYSHGLLKVLASDSQDKLINLLQPKLGAWAIWASTQRDQTLNNLLSHKQPKSAQDGWLTRSQPLRPPMIFKDPQGKPKYTSEESIIFKLAGRCIPKRIEIDCRHFLGDAPAYLTVEFLDAPSIVTMPLLHQIEFINSSYGGSNLQWDLVVQDIEVVAHACLEILLCKEPQSTILSPPAKTPSKRISKYHQSVKHEIEYSNDAPFTHLKLSLIPDGGLSRVKVFGVPCNVVPSDLGGRKDMEGGVFGGPVVAKKRRSSTVLFNSLSHTFNALKRS